MSKILEKAENIHTQRPFQFTENIKCNGVLKGGLLNIHRSLCHSNPSCNSLQVLSMWSVYEGHMFTPYSSGERCTGV